MKKVLCILTTLLVLLTGCKDLNPAMTETGNHYKVAVITGDGSISEAVYEAERVAKQYNFVETAVYDNSLSKEQTEKICLDFAEDRDIKAIVFVKAILGIDSAVEKVKAIRPDIIFICGAKTEDASFVAAKADICMAPDIYNNGTQIIDQAARMGATKFIYYTFARHLLIEPMFRRREIMIKRCGELGIDFIDITCPDPTTAEGGVEEARNFIKEDVASKVGDYGANTAFYCTDCETHQQLIQTVMENGAILPQQCCPNPFHGYPALFGVDTGKYDDTNAVLQKISRCIAPYGNSGRMSTWAVSTENIMVKAGVEYAIEYCEGRTDGTVDDGVLKAVIDKASDGRCSFSKYGTAKNCVMLLVDYYTF